MSELPPPPPLTPPPPPGAPVPPTRAGAGGRGTVVAIAVAVVLVLAAAAVGGLVLLGNHGSGGGSAVATATPAPTGATSPTPLPVSTPSSAATPTGPGVADFPSLVDALYTKTEGGQRGTCFSGDTTFAQCPVTDRLRSQLQQTVKSSQGDPICGCQQVDPGLSYQYQQNAKGGGVLHILMFNGSDRVDYVAVAAPGGYLVDDIIYCSANPPASIYPGEGAMCS